MEMNFNIEKLVAYKARRNPIFNYYVVVFYFDGFFIRRVISVFSWLPLQSLIDNYFIQNENKYLLPKKSKNVKN